MPGELQVTNHQLQSRAQSKLAVHFPCQVRPTPSSPTPGHSIALLREAVRGQCCVDELGFINTGSHSPCLNQLGAIHLVLQLVPQITKVQELLPQGAAPPTGSFLLSFSCSCEVGHSSALPFLPALTWSQESSQSPPEELTIVPHVFDITQDIY